MQILIKRLTPFILFGMFIVLLVFGFMLFAYLFLIGSIVGLVLFITQWVKDKLSHHEDLSKKHRPKRQARIIDVRDWTRH